jgi:hypothetical protein
MVVNIKLLTLIALYRSEPNDLDVSITVFFLFTPWRLIFSTESLLEGGQGAK